MAPRLAVRRRDPKRKPLQGTRATAVARRPHRRSAPVLIRNPQRQGLRPAPDGAGDVLHARAYARSSGSAPPPGVAFGATQLLLRPGLGRLGRPLGCVQHLRTPRPSRVPLGEGRCESLPRGTDSSETSPSSSQTRKNSYSRESCGARKRSRRSRRLARASRLCSNCTTLTK